MNLHDPSSRRNARLLHELANRWACMNLPVFYVSAQGIPELPECFSGTENAVPIKLIAAAIQPFLGTPLVGKTANLVEVFPGVTLVQVASPFGGTRNGRFIAVVSSHACLNYVPAELGNALSQFAQSDAGSIPGLAKLFVGIINDLSKSLLGEETVGQYAERLAQAYEETQLLFRMSRLLNLVEDPKTVLQGVCSQIQQVMPFRWIAILFGTNAVAADALKGQFFVAGEAESPDVIRSAIQSLLRDSEGSDNWTKILDPSSNPHAVALGTELLSEPISHDGKVIGLLLAGGKGGDDSAISSFELQFLDSASEFLGVFHQNISRFAEQKKMFLGTLRALTAAIDAKDPYTRGHSERVGLLAGLLGKALGLPDSEVERYQVAGIVHDVGKIGIPEAVLCKVEKLTKEEFGLIKRHPEIGHGILKDIPGIQHVLPGVLYHHEKWSGGGYPRGLAGTDIPLIGRVLALCDAFDAMSSNRSYRSAMTRESVLAEIRRTSGTQFDRDLVEPFLSMDFASFDEALQAEINLKQAA